MKNLALLCSSLALMAGPIIAADNPVPAPVSTASPTDPMAEVLPVLQSSYADFTNLHFKTGDTLSEIITRSKGQIELDPISATPTPILATALPDGTAYCRLETFTPKKDWDTFVADFRQTTSKPGFGAILDLRTNLTPNDYAGAAQVAGIFAPAEPAFLPYVASKEMLHPATYIYQGPVVVIVNDQTIGAAAVLASCLKANGALVVGQSTNVTASFFSEYKFSNSQVLRFATTAPSGLMATVTAITPDITMPVDSREKSALGLIRDNHILEVIEESAERRRMSEASLVHGQDPEWDDYLTSLEKGPVLLTLPHVHDPVLTGAIDSLRAIRFSQEAAPAQTAANASTPAPSSL